MLNEDKPFRMPSPKWGRPILDYRLTEKERKQMACAQTDSERREVWIEISEKLHARSIPSGLMGEFSQGKDETATERLKRIVAYNWPKVMERRAQAIADGLIEENDKRITSYPFDSETDIG